jgi:hypothetical protein
MEEGAARTPALHLHLRQQQQQQQLGVQIPQVKLRGRLQLCPGGGSLGSSSRRLQLAPCRALCSAQQLTMSSLARVPGR